MNKRSTCPHCKNTMGFSFGTCVECGFNYLDNQFHRISVSVDDLCSLPAYMLVDDHAKRTKDRFKTDSLLGGL